MSSFKQTLKATKPLLNLTFDGNIFDADNQLSAGQSIINDIFGYTTPVPMTHDQSGHKSYHLGAKSHVEAEGLAEDYAIRFVPNGVIKDADRNNVLDTTSISPKCYIESDINFSGLEFSLSFSIKKEPFEMTDLSSQSIFDPTLDLYYVYEPILDYEGVIKIRNVYSSRWNESSQLWSLVNKRTQLKIGNLEWIESSALGLDSKEFCYTTPFRGRNFDILDSNWYIITLSNNELSVYKDGIKKTTDLLPFILNVTTFEVINSQRFFVGATPTNVVPYVDLSTASSDRLLSKTEFDNIVFWDYELSDIIISDLIKRRWFYDTLLDKMGPHKRYAFDDLVNNNKVKPESSSHFNLLVTKTKDDYLVSRVGRLHNQTGIRFGEGTQLSYYTHLDSTFKFSRDYTLSMNFKVERSVGSFPLISNKGTKKPHQGVTVWINSTNGQTVWGQMEVQLDENTRVPLYLDANINDNRWHNITIRHSKSTNTIDIFVDGTLSLESYFYVYDTTYGILNESFIHNDSPNSMDSIVTLSEYIIFNSVVDDIMLTSLANYQNIYTVSGTTTLQGQPHSMMVRAYIKSSGKLVGEVLSESGTGLFSLELANNYPIYLHFHDPLDESVKLRTIGVIYPDTAIDVRI